MNPSKGKQQRAELTVPALQLDRDVKKLALEPFPDIHNCSERTMDDGRYYLRKITQLIEHEKWRELDSFLRSCTGESAPFDPIAECMNEAVDEGDVSTMNIVHFACRFNPPRSIIRLLALMYPGGVKCPDKTGRLPLHHCAKWGCSHRLIELLIEMHPSAVSVKDSRGKTPIHYLCSHYMDAFRSGYVREESAEEGMIQAIEALLEADLTIVSIEDDLDYTALEYAIESNAPYRVVRRLQKATERYWKEQQNSPQDIPLGYETAATYDNPSEEKIEERANTAAKKPAQLPLSKKPPGRSKYAMTA